MARAREVEGIEAESRFGDAAAEIVAVRAAEVFALSERVLDTRDIERVHDMRVATRRLRAALEVFAACFPRKRHRSVLRDVKRLADALGARRDPDVAIESLAGIRDALQHADRAGVDSLIGEFTAEQAAGNEVLAAALDEARESDLEGRLADLAASARAEPEPEPEVAG